MVLEGTYRIERMIGRGAMSTLYEASHLRLSRRFAVKILSPSLAVHAEALARFRREADVTSALGHLNILDVVDFNQTPDGTSFIVMELLEGEDLGQRLERVERLELPAAVSIFRQVASAVAAAHDKGIVHRDLKPPNIYLCRRAGRDDFVKVVDFGISKVLTEAEMTQTDVILGSPAHMAPEQAAGRPSQVDARSDVYALGAILFEMLTGQPPILDEALPVLLEKILHEPAPLLSSCRDDLPAELDAVVARALAKAREERFQTMAEFAAAVERAVGGSLDAAAAAFALDACIGFEPQQQASASGLFAARTEVSEPPAGWDVSTEVERPTAVDRPVRKVLPSVAEEVEPDALTQVDVERPTVPKPRPAAGASGAGAPSSRPGGRLREEAGGPSSRPAGPLREEAGGRRQRGAGVAPPAEPAEPDEDLEPPRPSERRDTFVTPFAIGAACSAVLIVAGFLLLRLAGCT